MYKYTMWRVGADEPDVEVRALEAFCTEVTEAEMHRFFSIAMFLIWCDEHGMELTDAACRHVSSDWVLDKYKESL